MYYFGSILAGVTFITMTDSETSVSAMSDIDIAEECYVLRVLTDLTNIQYKPELWTESLKNKLMILCDVCANFGVAKICLNYHASDCVATCIRLTAHDRLAELVLTLTNNLCCYTMYLNCVAYDERLFWRIVEAFMESDVPEVNLEALRLFLTMVVERGPQDASEEAMLLEILEADHCYDKVLESMREQEEGTTAQVVLQRLLPLFMKNEGGYEKLVNILIHSKNDELSKKAMQFLAFLCDTPGEEGMKFGGHMATPELVKALVDAMAVYVVQDRSAMGNADGYVCVKILKGFTEHDAGSVALLAHRQALLKQVSSVVRSYYSICVEDYIDILKHLLEKTEQIDTATLDLLQYIYKEVKANHECIRGGNAEWESLELIGVQKKETAALMEIIVSFYKELIKLNDRLPTGFLDDEWESRLSAVIKENTPPVIQAAHSAFEMP